MVATPDLRAVFLGAPGAGKGTQAQRLAAECGVLHISTGDMLREHVKAGTEFGKKANTFMASGKLVPDDVIIGMVEERIARSDAASAGPSWILDGFPRTLPQAEALDRQLGARGVSHAVWFAVPRDVLVARLSGRRTCGQCGAIWHVDFKPTRDPSACDKCGGPLVQREDDRPQAVGKRLEVFALQTEPLLAYYRQRQVLVELDADRTPEQVFADLVAVVSGGAESIDRGNKS
ncbi:MAG: adenylate kinase [Planctomycetota bacterium]